MPIKVDLRGRRFGKLLVLYREPPGSPQPRRWVCACDCGQQCKRTTFQLTHGEARHCGCNPAYIDITGQRYGRLVALEYVGSSSKKQALWLCQCDCGQKTTVRGAQLRGGRTKSCGCLMREVAAKGMSERQGTHRMTDSPEYRAWVQARARCRDSKHPAWKNYGGRGITVCERWNRPHGGFEAFFEDMGPRPSPKHSLDRIDNSAGYCKENCRWTTWSEQSKNKRPRLRNEKGQYR